MSEHAAQVAVFGPTSFREWPSWLSRRFNRKSFGARTESNTAGRSIEQLLAPERWRPTRRTHPELAKVLGFVQAELGEARRLLAKPRDAEAPRPRTAAHELKALLEANARVRTVDAGWELVGALKRFNLRIGDPGYVAGLLEYESVHAKDRAHWHTWTQHFPKAELDRLLRSYHADRATASQQALAVDRLTFLYLRRAEAGRNRRARAALKQRYLNRLAVALLVLVVALGASADSTSHNALWRSFALAACAGALGSTLSGVLRLRDHLNRLDELRGFAPAMRVQPLVGASAGALVFMFLASDAVSIGASSQAAWASPGLLGFVAGFSEPFFLGLVQRVTVIAERQPVEDAAGHQFIQSGLKGAARTG